MFDARSHAQVGSKHVQNYWLFTIYMGKPVGRWFVQMESKIPSWKFPFGLGVYHLNNKNQLTERA